ncbi:MAG: NAD-dependent epimerase/dehydratase family protein [Longimicrobiales bacterium]
MLRVVVTGVAGFIGSHLADRLLAEGHTVVGIDDLSQGVFEQVPSGVEFHRADIRSSDVAAHFEGAAAVFHLAAKNCISDCQHDPVTTMAVNVTGTANVLEAAARAGVQRVVYAESSALYEGVTRFPTPEDEIAPESIYAASKAASREVARAYARWRGLRLTALRYFCVYGPRQDHRRTVAPVMAAFIRSLLGGRRPTIYGTGEKRRDFVYVDDVNDFHMRCLTDVRTYGATYNLGSGVDCSVRGIFDEIRSLLGSDLEPEYALELPGEAERTCADIGRARALGWEPTVSLREGLRRSIEHIERELGTDVELARS